MSRWGLNKNMEDWASMLTYRYISPKGTVMDVKWEHNSDNGWAVCGNDWVNLWRGLEFPITYWELTRDGWKKVS